MESVKQDIDTSDTPTGKSLWDTEMYLKSLSPKEYKAYLIAKDHLGMSFDIEKSIGFLYWLSHRTE